MLHRAWEDSTAWGWAKRNVVSDARPPRVPRKGRKVWTVAQLQTFLQHARSDRFFALWVLEATSGMRRCELAGARRGPLDLEAGTLAIEVTRVVVDGRVVDHPQYVQTDLEADRQVANTLAELIIGGALATGVQGQGGTGEAA